MSVPILDKTKYLFVLRKRMKLPPESPEQAIFLLVDGINVVLFQVQIL